MKERFKMKSIITASLLLATSVLHGCSEEAQEAGADTSGTLPIPSDGQGINNGLAGRLITTYDFLPYEFDLNTGSASLIPLLNSDDFFSAESGTQIPQSPNFFAAGDSTPVQGYVETLTDCMVLPSESCISVYDSSYAAVKRIQVNNRILREPAKLSPSGQHVVLSQRDFPNFETEIVVLDVGLSTITDSVDFLNGEAGRGKRPDASIVEWGTDEEIYYSVPADDRPTVYVTEPGSLDLARTITLPGSYTGVISGMDIHPNGKELLIEYRGPENNGLSTILILNLDSLSIRIPAVDESDINRRPLGDSFASQFTSPTWAPDGTHIAFRNSDTTELLGGFPPLGRHCLIVVPAESDRVIVNRCVSDTSPLPENSPAILVQVENPSTGLLIDRWPAVNPINEGHLEWVR